ncbi:iron-siderophore ABC transporter substrate-binding protein [Endozoicomonas sp. SM1973]|uniref:Iron-siderophore ABC transporter substrate-binding protein n=1 Tax=Spartinivicinus marinus TaxID=2994442 RepID=A0A853HXI6_9GAMM|nr:iron-siderophore ABC transporter substrate-binding protein [Spartinivicinus marinus]MCX4029495.1 iron-siderophore ABC transporter substrate-binding protein [Spartinivicinus marinus]NYZ65069.1 iron-siderophore ABC transporter substrate-binding protein [Spartinivicinus marinus]
MSNKLVQYIWLVTIVILVGCQPADVSNETQQLQQKQQSQGVLNQSTSSKQQETYNDTRQVRDMTGAEVIIPRQPKRVIALSEVDLDSLIALGMQPVGATAGRGQITTPSYLADHTTDVTIVGRLGLPSIDKLIELKPDLILAGGFIDPVALKQVKKIAPTLVTHSIGENWKQAFQRTASLLGQEQAAEIYWETYNKRVSQLKSALGENANAKISVVRWNPKGPSYMLGDSFISSVLNDIQLKRPETQNQPGAGHSPPLSLEALEKIDGDWLFVGTLVEKSKATQALEHIKATQVFQQLKAVQNNHVVNVDGSLWTSVGGPLAAMAVLNDLATAFEGS